MANNARERTCAVCSGTFPSQECVLIRSIQPAILKRIRQELPDLDGNGQICVEDMNRFRSLYLREMVQSVKGDLDATEEAVLASLKEGELVSLNAEDKYGEKLSAGQRMADKVARFGGSWTFIGTFGAVIAIWIIINTIVLATRSYDPYPFILLNLILSCLAAIQAPVIMMSQNRQESKDRLRSMNDYQVNLKAELEVRILNQKLDYLTREWLQSMEMQELQANLLEDLLLQSRPTADKADITGKTP